MKTKERIKILEDQVYCINDKLMQLSHIVNSLLSIPPIDPNSWAEIPDPPITVSMDDEITSSTVTMKKDIPFSFTGDPGL